MGPAGNDFGHMLANIFKVYLDHKLYPLSEGSKYYKELGQAICKMSKCEQNVLQCFEGLCAVVSN